MSYGISQLALIIAGLCCYCGIHLNDVEITYAPMTNTRVEFMAEREIVQLSPREGTVSDSIMNALALDYPNGFTFDTTAVRLLTDKAGVNIDENIQAILKQMMFRRSDNLYFLIDTVADLETRRKIVDTADDLLANYGCFEISELYSRFADSLNNKCIDSLDNFVIFYEFINKSDVRCVTSHGTRIARVQENNLRNLFLNIAVGITTTVRGEFGGVVSEDDLQAKIPAFSTRLLKQIIKESAEELVKTEINGIVCYQTLDTLGLSDEFSIVLSEVLAMVDDIGLTPSEEVIHTALSLKMGVNFKTEYNIPDDKTYRCLIAAYYKDTPRRKWKRGIFAEVED